MYLILSTSQYVEPANLQSPSTSQNAIRRTSQRTAFLQVVYSLPIIALPKFFSDQSRHHALNPLFSDDRILRCLQSWCIVVVNTVESWRDLRFLCKKGLRFGSWSHRGGWQSLSREDGG